MNLLPALIGRELLPFPTALASAPEPQLRRLASEYREWIARAFPGAVYVTDKRPDNFFCIGLIKTLFPDALIVHTTRNPLDTCLSMFFLHLDLSMSYALDLLDIGHFYRQYRRVMAHWKMVYGRDIVDFDWTFASLVARKLVDLGARDGVAAVLGNHDYYADADAVATALRAGGVDVLVDAGRIIRPDDGGGFALLGVDDLWSIRYGRAGPRLERATAMVPPELARVLLSHQPPTVDLWAGAVALQMSGHTHGGQVRVPFLPPLWMPKGCWPYMEGWYDAGGSTMYVSRGM